jgi:glyoxylase-like metal-dependent hydrolase (beta-lactamase superfamily II)
MIRDWILPGLLDTGPVGDQILAIRDAIVNFFVVKGAEGLVCVDAGWRPRCVRHGFAVLGLDMRDVAAVFLTHKHWDHARCCDLYPAAQVFASGETDRLNTENRARVHDGQVVTAAGLSVRTVETPGHTLDSVCYVVNDRFLFTGDAFRLRRGKVVPFPSTLNRDREAANCSLRKLAQIRGVECLLTAHSGTTTDVEAAFMDWHEAEPDAVLCQGDRP